MVEFGPENIYSGYYQKTSMFIDKNIKKTAKIENRGSRYGVVTIEMPIMRRERYVSRAVSWCAMTNIETSVQ